jgi:hypothetical protein
VSGSAKVWNCVLDGNAAFGGGAGAFGSTLNNCLLIRNSSTLVGGGAYGSLLNNCSVTGNSAFSSGGGAYLSALNNCIVHYNVANTNSNYSGVLNYCCTTPLPSDGIGNIEADPQLASLSHLSAASPCVGGGNPAFALGSDIDGESWANPPSIGCDELQVGTVAGPIGVSIRAPYTTVLPGSAVTFTAETLGKLTASRWEFDDGTIVSNHPYASHTWGSLGQFQVVLRAFNEGNPAGVAATALVQVVTQPVHYVAVNNPTPVVPYASWSTAATNIQDAVDAATVPGALVLVSNGIYAAGGRVIVGTLTNRLTVMLPLALQSVNGPAVTWIEGSQVPGITNGDNAVRCVYLTSGASLTGFTLTNGATRSVGDSAHEQSGGAVWCASPLTMLTNCVIAGSSSVIYGGGVFSGTLNNTILSGNSGFLGGGAYNSTIYNCTLVNNSGIYGGAAYLGTLNTCSLANNSASSQGGGVQGSILNGCILSNNFCSNEGGGASFATLNNCVLLGNHSGYLGGGTLICTLNNCTLVGNLAANYGGGSYESTHNNCIIYFNGAPTSPNYDSGSSFNYCCTYPLPPTGSGNFTNSPLFVDQSSGNLRLASNSPCINSGYNLYSPGPTDLDGNPRIVGGTVDVGAYEFQAPTSAISYAWLQQHGLPSDGSADYADPDLDGMNNYQEWRCGTDPFNPASLLRIVSVTSGVSGLTVSWQSVSGTMYSLQRSSNFAVPPAFFSLQTNIVGQAGITAFGDTNAIGTGPFFYRIEVQ